MDLAVVAGAGGSARRPIPGRASTLAFIGVLVPLFGASLAATISWCASMSAMEGMPMPGGWTMSMAWMRAPDQSWLDALLSFVAMWSVMMLAMMLPSLAPVLWRHRRALADAGAARPGWQTTFVAAGYFTVWFALGAMLYPPGVALAAMAMREPDVARAVPAMAGMVVLAAGLLQLGRWKGRQLACSAHTMALGRALQPDARAAWRAGLRLGIHCSCCCAPLMAVLLVAGIMDVRAMAAVTVAVTLERTVPAGGRVARATGAVVVLAGVVLVARAAGIG